jgi:transcriptional regulator with XRE-family HTH domain
MRQRSESAVLSAEQFRELRLAAGLSIYALADRAGVHWQTVLIAEKAERSTRMRHKTRRRLNEALRSAVEEQAVLVAVARWLLSRQAADVVPAP